MNNILYLLVVLFLLSACSVSQMNQGANAKEGYGYLKISGNTDNISLSLNGQTVQSVPVMLYELKGGSYNLVVTSGGDVILRRLVLISASLTTEVIVP
ncbi:MAG: hypothetical protein Q8M98_06810 [Candidatus Cloacimonadaceae bacterium]|nr:hypothetical protein [Candidatus Cloacimonadaceae bacterium]MDP3114470.1 hypothetical protein [Candidatus Cloacimonadaceae bacterium]